MIRIHRRLCEEKSGIVNRSGELKSDRDDGSFGNADFGLPAEYEVRYCKRKTRM